VLRQHQVTQDEQGKTLKKKKEKEKKKKSPY
jgi:hypothetical protein